jgi:hypothetical protein
LLWIALGAIKLQVAHTGTRSAGILSLRHSNKVTLSKHQRWWEGAIGIGFLGLGVAHMILAYLHRT